MLLNYIKLNSKKLITVINYWAIAALAYSFDQILHVPYANQISNEALDKHLSLAFLKKWYLRRKIENFIIFIHNKIIRLRNYEKHVRKLGNQDKCRKYATIDETIEHIISYHFYPQSYISRWNIYACSKVKVNPFPIVKPAGMRNKMGNFIKPKKSIQWHRIRHQTQIITINIVNSLKRSPVFIQTTYNNILLQKAALWFSYN